MQLDMNQNDLQTIRQCNHTTLDTKYDVNDIVNITMNLSIRSYE
jgi:hypothetical protein